MEDNILEQVKRHLGIIPEDTAFDLQLIDNINTAFFVLSQLGIGPIDAFQLQDGSEVWSDFIQGTIPVSVKTYVPLYVRSQFDPPQNSFVLENINKELRHLEFRMMVEVESYLAEPADMTGIYISEEE